MSDPVDIDDLRSRYNSLTFDEIMQILEEEMDESSDDDDDSYRPLNFDEDYG